MAEARRITSESKVSPANQTLVCKLVFCREAPPEAEGESKKWVSLPFLQYSQQRRLQAGMLLLHLVGRTS